MNEMFQINMSTELQFLFYLGPITIGFQLAIYYVYQYFRIKDPNLQLNRILLSYGMLSLFIIIGTFFINNSRLFQTDPNIKLIFSKIGWTFCLSSPIIFLLFITNEEFSEILNVKISKILMILNCIPVVASILVQSTDLPIFRIGLLFVLASVIYSFYVQFNLIKKTVGEIKNRFVRFLLGEITAMLSLFFAIPVGLGIWPPGISEIMYYMGTTILFIGFIILFASTYNFPPIYEFNFKENLLKLYIINQKDYNCLYYRDFKNDLNDSHSLTDVKLKDHNMLFTKGIAGIENVFEILTGAKEKINQIKQEDSLILLKYGKNPSFLTYALLVKKDLKSFTPFLNTIRTHF